ncbi:L-glyceraldehyde 3-phosphate reductase domain protein [Escherichia coli DEC2D]|uniref:L-glyceraldehyde 3-phosphate reductase domain protein n=1 Tax=Escherichia coli DEC2D TaxID=868141 RepID=A0A828U3X6_ECOLX|nr:L-glyceraldehyde 3-phosphate reductase domain protein [Escherichia coli DEC2D]
MVWLANPERYGQMQYRYCGKSGLRLPALSLGLWHNFGHVNALESQRAILRKAFDLGITHFDLANNYGPPPGSAEENFGRLLREDFAAYRDELKLSRFWGSVHGPVHTALAAHVNTCSPASTKA